MISIEKTETNKEEHWKSETNLSRTMNCVSDWANAKSMAKIWYKFHGPRQICLRFPKSNFVLDLVLDPVLDSVLDQTFSKSKIFLKGKFFPQFLYQTWHFKSFAKKKKFENFLFLKRKFFFHNFCIKHDILSLFAKKKNQWKFVKFNFVLDLVLDSVLDFVLDLVLDSVLDCVFDLVLDSFLDFVLDSVFALVLDSVLDFLTYLFFVSTHFFTKTKTVLI